MIIWKPNGNREFAHPDWWAIQLRSPWMQTGPRRRSCWHRSSCLIWTGGRKHSCCHLQAQGKEKNPTVVPFPATSWSCRSSSRWRTSFSAAATTLLRFCRKFCSSAHRSNPRRASRFLGLKHRPWVLRPGHQHYILLLAVVNSSCACVYVYKLVHGQHNVINEKEQHHRQASANCCSCYQECKWECRAEHDVLLWY